MDLSNVMSRLDIFYFYFYHLLIPTLTGCKDIK